MSQAELDDVTWIDISSETEYITDLREFFNSIYSFLSL